jgi:hypothetical protein
VKIIPRFFPLRTFQNILKVSLEKSGKENKLEDWNEKSTMIGLRDLLSLNLRTKKKRWSLNKLSTFNHCMYSLMEQKINGVLKQ